MENLEETAETDQHRLKERSSGHKLKEGSSVNVEKLVSEIKNVNLAQKEDPLNKPDKSESDDDEEESIAILKISKEEYRRKRAAAQRALEILDRIEGADSNYYIIKNI